MARVRAFLAFPGSSACLDFCAASWRTFPYRISWAQQDKLRMRWGSQRGPRKMTTNTKAEPTVPVTDAPDDNARARVADGLSGYNDEKAGYRDYRPLAVV